MDLFSGIGGFALAARWMGWETIQFVEIDPFCQKVLNKNFPNVPIHGDIKTFNGSKYRGTVDILTGGFPCQPFSSAGSRNGTKDSRHLWPEMLRTIRQIQPTYILGENVYGIITWSKGVVFESVCTDLENEGYQIQPVILPACAVNAPHRRDRVWFVAYSKKNGNSGGSKAFCKQNGRQIGEMLSKSYSSIKTPVTNSTSIRCNRNIFNWQTIQRREFAFRETRTGNSSDWIVDVDGTGKTFEPAFCRENDGLSEELESFGNAIVPQVAYEIFKAIETIAA